jgi:hypothetical protein
MKNWLVARRAGPPALDPWYYLFLASQCVSRLTACLMSAVLPA